MDCVDVSLPWYSAVDPMVASTTTSVNALLLVCVQCVVDSEITIN